jgi:antirestriction protein ArdC
MSKSTNPRADVYTRVTDRIIADLEQGVRPWMKQWSADNAGERITRPLRHNGIPYRGINVLLLWGEAVAKGYGSATWMTYKQADELGSRVRRGEHGSMVVFADRFTKTETDDHGEEIEQDIPFMKAYSVFNVEQIDDLPTHYYTSRNPRANRCSSSQARKLSSASLAQLFVMVETWPTTRPVRISSSCPRPKRSTMQRATPPRKRTSLRTGRPTLPAWRASLANVLATMLMRSTN